MLWMKEKISTVEVMIRLILPSYVCLLVPLVILSAVLRGDVGRPTIEDDQIEKAITPAQQQWMLVLGLAGLLFVPIFKVVTHLPPFMGILLSLSVVWIVSERIRKNIDHEYTRSSTHVIEILKRVDSSSILFFLGILLAVSCLSHTGLLELAAQALNQYVGNLTIVAVFIGLISAVVDNVPLVAAGIEMYKFETDHTFWHLLAYCAGTGGSCLIIGSAAGVAAMGLERIDFLWYLRKIAPLALAGYLAGVGVYVLLQEVFGPSSAPAPAAALVETR
jgi:Na+/H+ antiporter NhaD/arsenite permease-like protein